MKQSQFYYLLRRGLFNAGSAIIKNGLVMFNKFTTAGISHPAQGSAEFNGTSDYIDLPNDIITDTDNYTLGVWYYFDTQTTNDSILSFGYSANDTPIVNLELVNDGTVIQGFHRLDNSSNSTLTHTISTSGEWNYLVVTKDESDHKLYLNGSVVSSNSSATTGTLTFDQISIGSLNRVSNINFWEGNLANVAIWNRALSSDEINSVMWKSYEALTSAESNGLQAWYSLDDITNPAASLANMEQLATDKNATIENKAAITAAINALS